MLRYDGPVIMMLGRIGDMIILNMLWLLCCIPIVTIGPATIAAHYVALKLVRDEGTSVAKMFVKSFRQNFRQGVVLGLMFLLIGGVLGFDLWLLLTGRITFAPAGRLMMMSFLWLLMFLYLMVMLYLWAVMARFENTVKQTVFNAWVLAVANIRTTLMMICWDVSLAAAAVLCAAFVPQLAVLFMVLGVPALFLLNAVKLRPLLDGWEKGGQGDKETGALADEIA